MPTIEKILILDFGSQYTQLIARKVRECGVYSEIHPFNISEQNISNLNPNGIILSGSPSSVYDEDSPKPSFLLHNLNVPILGICYGLQLLAYQLGGAVDRAAKREFGKANLQINASSELFEGVPPSSQVWMSHGDRKSVV